MKEQKQAAEKTAEIEVIGSMGGVPMSVDLAFRTVDDAIRDLFRSHLTIGRACNFLKDSMGHGKFVAAAKERYEGILSIETIQRSMKVATFADENPKIADALDFKGLRKTVQLMLAKSNLSDEDLSDEDGTISGIPIADLKAGKVKQLKKELEQTKLDNEELTRTLDQGREQLQALADQVEYEKKKHTWINLNDQELKRRLDHQTMLVVGVVHDFSDFKAHAASSFARCHFFSAMNFLDQMFQEIRNRKRMECDGIEFEVPPYELPSPEEFFGK